MHHSSVLPDHVRELVTVLGVHQLANCHLHGTALTSSSAAAASTVRSINQSILYGLEACPLIKSDLQSLDFVINRFFMKLFTTKSTETVKYCQEYFDFSLPSVLWAKRVSKFEVSFEHFCLCCNYCFDFNLIYILLIVFCHVCLVNEDSHRSISNYYSCLSSCCHC